MARSQQPSLDLQALTRGVTVELDSKLESLTQQRNGCRVQ